MAAFVEVRDLRKCYGRTVALAGVTFDVAQGELFGLLGPNGAGKTTLLSILSCLLEADGGVPVRELNGRFGLGLPESPRYITVAGLLLERLGNVPQGGESVEVDAYRLAVAAMAGRRIARVRIESIRAPQPT